MNKIILTITLCSAIATADSLDFSQRDKQMHFAVGALSGAFVQAFVPKETTPLTRLMVSTLAAITIGIAKEVYDNSRVGNFDANDVAATSVGGFVIGTIYMIGWLE